MPSVIICFNFEKYVNNENDYHNCEVSREHKFLTCSNISVLILTRRKNNSICFTYFYESDQSIEQGHKVFDFIMIRISGYDPVQLTFHSHWTPSHFEKLNKFHLIKGETDFQFKRTRTRLLPHPYSTDCYDYSSNIANNFGPKSQKECILEEIKRKERQVCGKYFFWNQIVIQNKTESLIFNQDNCPPIEYDNGLAKSCKVDCIQNT